MMIMIMMGWLRIARQDKSIDVVLSIKQTAVKEAEAKECLDPYELAVKYLHTILNIHPFLDLNSALTTKLISVT